jgi:valyl-tRNA synthetase
MEVWLPLDSMVDRVKEMARMSKQAAKLQSSMEGLAARLNSDGFASKAPQQVVDEVRNTFRLQEEQLNVLMKRMEELRNSV